MRPSLIAVSCWLLLNTPSLAAEITAANFVQEIDTLDPAKVTPAGCDSGVSTASTSNGPRLFYDAMVCIAQKRQDDGWFLFHAAQVRSLADMVWFQAGEEGKDDVAKLYGAIFFRFGGGGPHAFYRNTESASRLIQRLGAWTPQLPEYYSPGWVSAGVANGKVYAETMGELKEYRLAKLRTQIKLMADEEYFAAEEEFSVLQARNPQGFIVGTPDYARSEQLTKIISDKWAEVEKAK